MATEYCVGAFVFRDVQFERKSFYVTCVRTADAPVSSPLATMYRVPPEPPTTRSLIKSVQWLENVILSIFVHAWKMQTIASAAWAIISKQAADSRSPASGSALKLLNGMRLRRAFENTESKSYYRETCEKQDCEILCASATCIIRKEKKIERKIERFQHGSNSKNGIDTRHTHMPTRNQWIFSLAQCNAALCWRLLNYSNAYCLAQNATSEV